MGSAVRHSRAMAATRALPGASLGDAGAWLLGFGLIAYLAFWVLVARDDRSPVPPSSTPVAA